MTGILYTQRTGDKEGRDTVHTKNRRQGGQGYYTHREQETRRTETRRKVLQNKDMD